MSTFQTPGRSGLHRTVGDLNTRTRRIESSLPPAQFDIKVVGDTALLPVGDGKFIFAIPDDVGGANLIAVAAYVTTVSSSGKPTVMIRNVTTAHDMLSTAITIDVGGYTSYAAAVPPVINQSYYNVSTGDLVAIDIDAAGVGAKGLGVILTLS